MSHSFHNQDREPSWVFCILLEQNHLYCHSENASVVQGTRKVLVKRLFSIEMSQLYIWNYFYQNTVLISICFYVQRKQSPYGDA